MLHLGDDDAAGVLGGLGQGQAFQQGAFVLHRHVAVLIGGGAADDGHVHGQGGVEHPLLVLELDDLDDIDRGVLVHLAALEAGIHEGLQADLGNHARAFRRDFPPQLADDALGQAVAFHRAVDDHLGHVRRVSRVAADPPRDHILVGEVLGALRLPVADPRRVDEGEPAGVAGFEKALLDPHGHFLRPAGQGEGTGAQGGAVLDEGADVFRTDDLGHDIAPYERASGCVGTSFPLALRNRCPAVRGGHLPTP